MPETPEETRAVVLDFDGVVLQSDTIKTQAFADLFADHPDATDAIVELHERYGGLSRYRKFDMIYDTILEQPLDDDDRAALGAEYSRLVLEKVLKCPMVDGAEAFLRDNPRSRPVYIASGSPHDELIDTIKARQLDQWITSAHGSPDEKPDVIRDILTAEAIEPKHIVFVGDAWSDFETAAVTGVRFIGVVKAQRQSPFPDPTLILPDLVALEAALPHARTPETQRSAEVDH